MEASKSTKRPLKTETHLTKRKKEDASSLVRMNLQSNSMYG